MFNKFQAKISKILEDVTSNSIGGGVFGPSAAEGGTFSKTPIIGDMSIAGGINPQKRKKKKTKKGALGWKKTPKVIRRPLDYMSGQL